MHLYIKRTHISGHFKSVTSDSLQLCHLEVSYHGKGAARLCKSPSLLWTHLSCLHRESDLMGTVLGWNDTGWRHDIHRSGKVIRVTALAFTGDVEAYLQRLQWIPGLSPWPPLRFSVTGTLWGEPSRKKYQKSGALFFDLLLAKTSCWTESQVTTSHISWVSCQKGPTRHAYAWQIGPFWHDTLDMTSKWGSILTRPGITGVGNRS